MTRHIVIWKLKPGLADAESVKLEMKKALENLSGRIPGLLRIKVHTKALDSSADADVMLDAMLSSQEALAAYASHPLHVEVADTFVKPYVEQRVCMDVAGASDLDETILTRRSIRKFATDRIPPRELVDLVVDAGLKAPTGRNQQSTAIIRVDDKTMQEKIRALNAKIMGTPPPGRPADPFYSAPVMLLVVANRKSSTVVYDGALALGHMMLKAHELGLASCWIHRAREEMETELGREILARAGLEGDYEGIGHLALGYADVELPPPRIPDPARYRAI